MNLTRKTTINLEERQFHWLRSYAYSNETQIGGIIRDAIDMYIVAAEEEEEKQAYRQEKLQREYQYEREEVEEDQESRDIRENRPEIPNF